MRHFEAQLDHDPDEGRFQVSRLTDENGNDVTYLVDRGSDFRTLEELERVLAAEIGSLVAVAEA